MALGLGAAASFALAQTLKGRVSLSFTALYKIVLIGGTLTLIKNYIEFTPKKEKLKSEEQPSLSPLSDTNPTIRITAGDTTYTHETSHINQSPVQKDIHFCCNVYEIPNNQKQNNEELTLLMTQQDYQTFCKEFEWILLISYTIITGDKLKDYGFTGDDSQSYVLLSLSPDALNFIASYKQNTALNLEEKKSNDEEPSLSPLPDTNPTIRIPAGDNMYKKQSLFLDKEENTHIHFCCDVYEIQYDQKPTLLMTEKDFQTLQTICKNLSEEIAQESYATITGDQLAQYGFTGDDSQSYVLLSVFPAALTSIAS